MYRDILFLLLRAELNCEVANSSLLEKLNDDDWVSIMKLAKKQGVHHIIFDAISKLPQNCAPSYKYFIKWCIQTEASEKVFESYLSGLDSLVGLMAQNGLKTMLLKGYTIARFYPVPARRVGGDIDIYLFGEQEKGDDVIRGLNKIVIENKKYSRHSTFGYMGVAVENHSTFITKEEGFYSYEKSLLDKIESYIQSTIDDKHLDKIRVKDNEVFILPPDGVALHQIIHTLTHTLSCGSAIRQYTDWVVFFNHSRDKLDREWLLKVIHDCKLGNYVANVEDFCARKLGFTPYFNLNGYDIKRSGALSIEEIIFKFRNIVISDNFFIMPIHILKRLFYFQRLHKEYIGAGNSDFLIPAFIGIVKKALGIVRYK